MRDTHILICVWVQKFNFVYFVIPIPQHCSKTFTSNNSIENFLVLSLIAHNLTFIAIIIRFHLITLFTIIIVIPIVILRCTFNHVHENVHNVMLRLIKNYGTIRRVFNGTYIRAQVKKHTKSTASDTWKTTI